MRRNELDAVKTVRRGLDPEQVHGLVDGLWSEHDALGQDNEALREQNATLREEIDRLSFESSQQHTNVISVWSQETNELLEVARQNVARVIREADADARMVRSTAEAAARTIRDEARAEAAEVVAHAEEHAANLIADAERSVAAAEARVTEIGTEAKMSEATNQASLDQQRAELHDLEGHVAELERERDAIRAHIGDLQSHLRALLSEIIVSPAAFDGRANSGEASGPLN